MVVRGQTVDLTFALEILHLSKLGNSGGLQLVGTLVLLLQVHVVGVLLPSYELLLHSYNIFNPII